MQAVPPETSADVREVGDPVEVAENSHPVDHDDVRYVILESLAFAGWCRRGW